MNEQIMAGSVFMVTVLMADKVDDLAAFYQKAFGFKSVVKTKNLSGRNVTEVCRYGSSLIVIREEGQFELIEVSPKKSKVPSPISISLICDDVDKMYEHAKANGAEVIFTPQISPWGSRICKLRDPSGYIWFFEKFKPTGGLELPVVQSY